MRKLGGISLPTVRLPKPASLLARPKTHDGATHAELTLSPKQLSDHLVVRRPLRAGEQIWFGKSGAAAGYLVQPGWHSPEDDHCWTSRSAALFAFNPMFDGAAFLHLDFMLLEGRSWAQSHFSIVLNRRTVFQGASCEPTNAITVRLGDALGSSADTNILVFHTDPIAPRDLRGHGDPRPLGVAIKRLWFA